MKSHIRVIITNLIRHTGNYITKYYKLMTTCLMCSYADKLISIGTRFKNGL